MLAPSPVKRYPVFSVALAAFGEWMQKRRLYRDARARLDACDGEEIARLAHDIGLPPGELRRMAAMGPDAARFLSTRIAALNLDTEAIAEGEPGTMRDLQRLCSNCVSKRRCQRDLADDPDDPVWRQYCPNAGTLGLLQREAAAG